MRKRSKHKERLQFEKFGPIYNRRFFSSIAMFVCVVPGSFVSVKQFPPLPVLSNRFAVGSGWENELFLHTP